jgi:acetolactate synthase-1/2/3 large subunit
MPSNADLVVAMLQQAGISCGFGIPSGNVLPLLEAMRAKGMRFVLTAHEGSAGFAADVMGRMTGRPGLCIATHGPGATNLATGIGCAFLDRSPLIAITCNVPTAQLGRRVQMHIDHHALMRPITKATYALRPGRIAATVADAVALATRVPKGPVHLDLPEDVALAPATEGSCAIPAPKQMQAAGERDLRAVETLIAAARRPVAVIGAGALQLDDARDLRRFVERHALPFATTAMAKGLIDEDHPLSLGCIERARRQVQRKFLRGADLIVGLGYDTAEVQYEAWIGDVPLVHVAFERADTDGSVRIAAEAVGELGASLQWLARGDGATEWPADAVAEQRALFQSSLRPPTNRFSPHQAIDVVRRVLPRDGILAFDVGAHTHQIAGQWAAHAPKTFLLTNNWSSMGFGLPAAIAAKLARPDLPVVAVIGDGCFQMTCGEVAAARREKLALPIVVLDDNWLALIKVKQERRSYAYVGTALDPAAPPRHYFGVPAVSAESEEALEKELRRALAADGPTVIEAQVDAAHYSETVYD